MTFARDWLRAVLDPTPSRVTLQCLRQGWSYLRLGRSVDGTPLRLKGQVFERGLGTHADAEIAVTLDAPARRLRAWVGVDENQNSLSLVAAGGEPCALVFAVETDQGRIWESPPRTVGDPAMLLDLSLESVRSFRLVVEARDGYNQFGHADWADAQVELSDGTWLWLGETPDAQRLPQTPVCSFRYDDKPSSDFFRHAETQQTTWEPEQGVTVHRKTATDRQTGLTCVIELTEFSDFPAVEYVMRFRNDGTTDTPILEDIHALDVSWTATGTTRLHRSRGSRGHIDDFAYQRDEVTQASGFPMVAGDGRSSTNWLPYFSLESGNHGVIWAIGWSGQWAASVTRGADDAISLRAGLERTRISLHPGEEIRMPKIALLFWEGVPLDGTNLWRRFLLAHHAPRSEGADARAPVSATNWGGVKTETHLETIAMLQDHHAAYDVFWIDAGWYGTPESYSPLESTGKWYGQAGNWEPNPLGHPDGLRPIGDAAHQAGMRFLLWFELERAVWGTALTQQHPDWFLGEKTPGTNVLLDLGNPDARTWMIEYLSGRIMEWGIDWYRQDFNFEPLPYWRGADAPDRQGMAEIGHVQGLYAVWDELLRRHPGLKIDNCASGGQRLDLELVSRSVALWRSDYQCFPTCDPLGAQNHASGLSYWVPLSGTSAHVRPEDTYNFRSALSAAIGFPVAAPANGNEYPWAWHRAMLDQYRRARPFYFGDYYPLTRFSTERDTWFVYQMHRQDLDAGMIVAFRREECPYLSAEFPLSALGRGRSYRFENLDTGEVWIASGDGLIEPGLSLTLAQPRASALIFYTTVLD